MTQAGEQFREGAQRRFGGRAVVVAVFNNKGGAGKTTVISNLAYALWQSHGLRVLAIDNDSQYNLSNILGREHPSEIRELTIASAYMTRGATASRYVMEASPLLRRNNQGDDSELPGFGFIYGSGELAVVERDILTHPATRMRPMHALHKILHRDSAVMGFYDIILIDLPPAFSALALNGLTAADYVIIPVRLTDSDSIHNLDAVLDTVDLVREDTTLETLGFLRNGLDRRKVVLGKRLQKQIEQISAGSGVPILETVLPDSSAYQNAKGDRLCVGEYDSRIPASSVFRRLGEEVMNHIVRE